MAQPASSKGVYRIKNLSQSDQALYMQLDTDNSSVDLRPLDISNDKQKWNITLVKDNTYKITSFDEKYTLSWADGGPDGKGYLLGKEGADTTWTIESLTPYTPRFTATDKTDVFVDSGNNQTILRDAEATRDP
ncbi:hypothetical protein BOTBODRAFT_39532 [Botryobasidium botryosum FD-172 SS1]|uniref:Ricin B lectin domain-containing protein n=1 Tax=Botryobasidium botryosum (strain FD-172 SS1) TaxID=930990 RepID=A0A067M3V6_BOTB1|nr:hypothetical protein BOTBODRAFT_39532 [Botryobasidium botryosum FD-172 SS1]